MSTLKVGGIRGVSASSDAITVANDGTCTANVTNNLSNRRMNINGGMLVWQRSASISVSDGSNEGVSACDRYGFEFGNSSAGAAIISQSTDVPTNLGFPYSFKIDVTTINNNSASNTQIRLPYRFEAQDIANSGWKYNDPNSFLTISFYFKSNKSGTNKLPVQIRTFDGTAYFYIAEITQSDTNWNRYTVKIPGNSNLTFNNDNGMGLEVAWYFAVGTDYHTTADTWGTAQKHGTSNSTNYFNSTSNDMFITGIQMEATTNGIATDFEHRAYGQELDICKRYFQQYGIDSFRNNTQRLSLPFINEHPSNVGGYINFRFEREMRAAPTATIGSSLELGQPQVDRSSYVVSSFNSLNPQGSHYFQFSGGQLGSEGDSNRYIRFGHDANAFAKFSAEF